MAARLLLALAVLNFVFLLAELVLNVLGVAWH
jgi:uncharacterized membrane protein